MKRGHLVFVLLALFVAACTRPPTPVSPPTTVVAIAVFPPNNRTGDDPLVAGGTLFEKYGFKTERVTISDVIAGEARLQLTRRGYTLTPSQVVDAAVGEHPPASASEAATLVAQHAIDATALYIEIRRWEPDVPFNPSFVIVSIEATLIDPSSGRVLWTADHPSRPVPTPGVVNPGQAYVIAAAKVMEEMLSGLEPMHAAPESSRP
jgi:hypothetical protein